MIELDELLTGKPSWEQVADFFENGEFCEEHYLVEAIEKWLLTEDQRKLMFDHRLTIEKMLNGRYAEAEPIVYAIYAEWNEKLGTKHFGS